VWSNYFSADMSLGVECSSLNWHFEGQNYAGTNLDGVLSSALILWCPVSEFQRKIRTLWSGGAGENATDNYWPYVKLLDSCAVLVCLGFH
jgi:hypothetical protein